MLVHQPRIVGGVSLVAHLGGELGVGCLLGKPARLVNRPGERLLHVYVLAEVHRGQRDDSVQVIGRGHHYAVDVLLLLEHLTVVGILGGLAVVFRKPLHVGHLLDVALAHLGLPGRDRGIAAGGCRRRGPGQPLFNLRGVRTQFVEGRAGVAPVRVAQRDDVLAGQVGQVGAPHPPDPDAGDIEAVAWRHLAAASQDVTRDDGEAGVRRGGLEELASRNLGVVWRSSAILPGSVVRSFSHDASIIKGSCKSENDS